MKKFLVLFFMAALILSNCGGSKEFVGSVYTDPEYNFEVKLPEGWKTFPRGGELRLKTVYTEFTREIVRSEKLRMDGGVEIDPAIYVRVIPGNKDINEFIEKKIKKSYMTEFYTLFPDDIYRNTKEITREIKVEVLGGSLYAHSIEIKEKHQNPQQRHPITHVYGFSVITYINFVVFKKDDKIYYFEFICPEVVIEKYIREFNKFVDSFKLL
ncbi:hypothetical protein KAS50_04050 [bacterium]|nr:hypothetical protein [bacterium]